MKKVLLVEDNQELRDGIRLSIEALGYQVSTCENGLQAVEEIPKNRYDFALMDVDMPVMNGIEALKRIKQLDPAVTVVMMTAYSNLEDAVNCIKIGAYHYLAKPVKMEELTEIMDKATKAHQMVQDIVMSAPILRTGEGNAIETEFVGQSEKMRKVFSIIDRLSKVDTSVLIRGESGTGKELVAKAIHYNSHRKEGRFVAVNCSAIPESLIESELFGHEKGSFTGADQRKIGKFQYADGGTLFLDELGDISLATQVKLLRAIQERKITPVGSNREFTINVRILAATHRPLEQLIKEDKFREDLFYRLNVLPIFLPPLRERLEDLPYLAGHFIQKFNEQHRRNIQGISRAALGHLKNHNFPGNIRELENIIEHCFVMEETDTISENSLPEHLLTTPLKKPIVAKEGAKALEMNFEEQESLDLDDHRVVTVIPGNQPDIEVKETIAQKIIVDDDLSDFNMSKEKFEREFIWHALKKNKGRINATARNCNIPKKTLLRKIEKYQLNPRELGGFIESEMLEE